MISFQWLWAFAALPLPLFARLLMPQARPGKAGALRVPFFGALAHEGIVSTGPRRRGGWRLLLLWLIWVLLVAAAARPAYIGPPVPIPMEGRDLMMAVDLSGSMSREDFNVSGIPLDRLTVVKAVADDFVSRRTGDRVGLILFSSRAYIQSPLTFDRNVVRALLKESSIGMTGQETAIGDAIALAVKTLRDRPEDQRVLILLTDGANTAGVLDPLQAAQIAQREHVKIYTIGVGADPASGNMWMVNTPADLDEKTLAEIAKMTGGQYFRARDTAGLAAIYQDIDRLEPAAGEPLFLRPTVSLFPWPLGAALGLSLLLGLILAWPARAARVPDGEAHP